jgi:ABC-type multidrug transport system ATPase subunit
VLLLSADDPVRGSLRLGDGEVVALLGASGSGKTEWFRSLLGLRHPLAMLRSGGQIVTPGMLHQRIGWVPDGDGVFLSQTVWGNVAEAPHLPVIDRSIAADALDRVALLDRAAEPVAVLARSERRRVALARALALRREILLIDSPMDATLWAFTDGLLEAAPWVRGLIVGVAAIDHVVLAADTVALMSDGAVLTQGPWLDLIESVRGDVRAALRQVR